MSSASVRFNTLLLAAVFGLALPAKAQTNGADASDDQWQNYVKNEKSSPKTASPSARSSRNTNAPAVFSDPNFVPGQKTVEGGNSAVVPNWNPPAPQQRNEVFIPASPAPMGGLYGLRSTPMPAMMGGRYVGPNGIGAFNSHSRLPSWGRPMTIQTGPSPSSGNYYQPSSADPSASGSYYASGNPWQTPVINNGGASKDYWGPDGNPFQQKK